MHLESDLSPSVSEPLVSGEFFAVSITIVHGYLPDAAAVLGLRSGASTDGHHGFDGPAGILTIAAIQT